MRIKLKKLVFLGLSTLLGWQSSTVLAAEYCYQHDYLTRAQTGDQITSGQMNSKQLSKERLGFPYKATLSKIRVYNANNQNDAFKIIDLVSQNSNPPQLAAFQGAYFSLVEHPDANCPPCQAKVTQTSQPLQKPHQYQIQICRKNKQIDFNSLQFDLVFVRE